VTWRLHGCSSPGWNEAGPRWLSDARVAASVVEALQLGEQPWRLYTLLAWVVMSNHVHLLIQPNRPFPETAEVIREISAREANRILRRGRQPFWQEESHEHWICTQDEFTRLAEYIEASPVDAGFVNTPADWPWSSAQ